MSTAAERAPKRKKKKRSQPKPAKRAFTARELSIAPPWAHGGSLVAAGLAAAVVAPFLAFFAIRAGADTFVAFLATVAPLGGLFVLLLTSAKTRVGTDGIALDWMGIRRFWWLRDVDSAVFEPAVVGHRSFTSSAAVLSRTDGTVERIAVEVNLRRRPEAAAEIVRSVQHALAIRAQRVPVDGAQELARNGRPVDAWRAALEGLTTGGGYRSGGVTSGGLTSILESPHSPPSARVAAAWLLRRIAADSAQTIRHVADEVAHPALLRALTVLGDRAADEHARDAALAWVDRLD
jgi:hypothetical protein